MLTNDSRNRTLSLISFLVTGLIFSFVGFPKTLFGTAVILVALLAMLPFSKNYVPALWYLGFSAVITFITFLSIPSMISLPIVILVSAVFFYLAVKTGKGDGEVDI
ncbi:hypothetical protein RQ359_001894 [Sulfuracidifex metallicus DSM 6482 = JCM 9184]|nr:hypothetical protein RQ359_001894 [Sulfuracidifex metallicus DSM 6482 = JCM 9184]